MWSLTNTIVIALQMVCVCVYVYEDTYINYTQAVDTNRCYLEHSIQ